MTEERPREPQDVTWKRALRHAAAVVCRECAHRDPQWSEWAGDYAHGADGRIECGASRLWREIYDETDPWSARWEALRVWSREVIAFTPHLSPQALSQKMVELEKRYPLEEDEE